MPILNQRIQSLQPSPTLSLSAKAKAMKQAGEDVINLSVGEPDFDTPDYAKQAAIRAIENGETKYTAVDGLPALKQAVIDKFQRDNNLSYNASEIVVSTGAKQILFNVLIASIDIGDEVIVPAPYWVSYPSMVHIAGGRSVLVDCPETLGFKLTAAQLEQAITLKTKWLVLNSPSNPTGAIYSEKELGSLADVLRQHPHVYVISDDIYEHLNYTDAPYVTLAQVAPDLKERIVTVNGVSKAYAMTGWRIGFAGGPEELMRGCAKIQGQSTSNPCSIAQHAAIAALNGPTEDLQKMRAIFQARRDRFVQGINNIKGLSVNAPAGAFYLFVNCAGWIDKQKLQSDMDVADMLLEEYKLAVVPGTAFGASPYLRMSTAVSEEDIDRALERLKQCVDGLKTA